MNENDCGRVASPNRLSSFGSSLLRSLAASRFNPARGRHVHEWHDWYVFDSSANVSMGGFGYRVVGQQIMQLCACGETNRKHLPTWRDARIARHRLPYKRWGVWSFSLPVPAAIAMEARQGGNEVPSGVSRRQRGPQGIAQTHSGAINEQGLN